MVAKKAPAKKTPPPSRTDKKGTSGMGKTQRNVVKRTDKSGSSGMGKTNPNAKRTDRAGSTGMGMTKSGVRKLAKEIGKETTYFKSGAGLASYDEYTGRVKDATIEKWADNDRSGKKAMKAGKEASARVYKKYGMTPKKK